MKVLFWQAALALSLLISTGCSSNTGHLQMMSLDGKHDYDQKFNEAYVSKTTTGDTDVVLISGPVYPRQKDPTQPIKPQASALYPSQIVHIRIYWKPLTGSKPDHPANTNASIHWYMLADSTPQPDYMEYSGSGLVEWDESSGSVDLKIVKAWMKAINHRGTMVDPLGPSMLKGSITATIDADEVIAVLAQIKLAAGPVGEAHSGQGEVKDPARMSVGQ